VFQKNSLETLTAVLTHGGFFVVEWTIFPACGIRRLVLHRKTWVRQRRKKLNKILENYFTRRLKPMENDWLKWLLSLVVILLTFWFLLVTCSWWLVVPGILVVAYHVVERYYQESVGSSYFGRNDKIHLDHDGNEIELEGWYWDNDPALANLAMSVNIDNTSFDLRQTVPTKFGALVSILFFTMNISMDGASREEILATFKIIRGIYPNASARYWFQEYFTPVFMHALADLAASGKFSPFASRINSSNTTLELMIMDYLAEKLKVFPKVQISLKCEIQRFEDTSLFPPKIEFNE